MLRRAPAQNEAGVYCSSCPLAKIELQAIYGVAIEALGKQESIQMELNGMESEKASRRVAGLGHALTKRDGRVSVLRRQGQNVSNLC
ncbi:hypothetical protein ASD03_09370 [Ensifer sp. Root127]|nr:hypothetical protein ASD03_09370 [Ensifer sp. Root127]